MPTNKLSPRVQAGIVAALLLMFGAVLLLPIWAPNYKVDADIKQTLFNLVTAVVFFFIGKNTDSAGREAAITAAAIAPVPAAQPAPVKLDDAVPVRVQDVATGEKPTT